MEAISNALLGYGLSGIVILGQAIAIIYLFKELQASNRDRFKDYGELLKVARDNVESNRAVAEAQDAVTKVLDVLANRRRQ